MHIIESALNYFTENTATVLLAVAILYFAVFIARVIHTRRTGGEFTYRLKYFIAFAAIIGLAVYCLATGKNLNDFIN